VLDLTQGMGVVTKLGERVSAFQPGQRVVGFPWSTKVGDGSWQQYVVVPEASLIAVPDDVSDEAAAQYAVNPITAYGLVDVRASYWAPAVALMRVACLRRTARCSATDAAADSC
jgi:NADPH:quinone reductase-like Zn-dependent oxidoreductase